MTIGKPQPVEDALKDPTNTKVQYKGTTPGWMQITRWFLKNALKSNFTLIKNRRLASFAARKHVRNDKKLALVLHFGKWGPQRMRKYLLTVDHLLSDSCFDATSCWKWMLDRPLLLLKTLFRTITSKRGRVTGALIKVFLHDHTAVFPVVATSKMTDRWHHSIDILSSWTFDLKMRNRFKFNKFTKTSSGKTKITGKFFRKQQWLANGALT